MKNFAGRVEEALSTSKHLLQFWRRADTSYFGDTAAPHITNLGTFISVVSHVRFANADFFATV